MELEKFRDQALTRSLFRFSSSDDLLMSCLRHWDSNARYSDKMARYKLLLDTTAAGFQVPGLKAALEKFSSQLPILFAGVDDHRATLAVEAFSKANSPEKDDEKLKKKGLLGMIGGPGE